MKRIAAMVLCALALSGCGDDLDACGRTFHTLGLFNEDERVDGVKYVMIPGNVVWSIILVSTVFAPVYFLGFSIYEPVQADCSEVVR